MHTTVLSVGLGSWFDFGISSVLNCIGNIKKKIARIICLYCEPTRFCDKRSGKYGATGVDGIIIFCILRSIAAHLRCVTERRAGLI